MLDHDAQLTMYGIYKRNRTLINLQLLVDVWEEKNRGKQYILAVSMKIGAMDTSVYDGYENKSNYKHLLHFGS